MSRSRYWAALVVAVAATGLVFVTSVLTGPTEVTIPQVVEALRSYDEANDAHVAARDIRLPRAVLILLVGASLAAAGAVMQGVTRNPLAGPSIMGLSGGAALASLVALVLGPGLGYTGSIVASFAGAAAGYGSVLAVTALSFGGFSPTRIALAGAVVSALFSAVAQGLVIALGLAGTMLYWTVGGVTNVTWEQVFAVLPCVAVGLVGVLQLAPDVTILSLGNEVAAGLGQRSGFVRVAATLLVLLLTGAAVAVAGPVSFVGLMTPHACRLVAGADYRRLLPLCVVAGAGLTAAADLAARTALGAKGELPLGVVPAVLGAPFFLWLLRSRRDQGLDGGPQPQVRPRPGWPPAITLAGAACLAAAVSAFALQHGRADIAPADVLRTLAGQGEPEHDLVIWTFRVPRLLFGLLVGMGIAVSGALMQAVLRNDLAEPGILGVSSGAGLAVVMLLATLGWSALRSVTLLPLASVGGALVTTLAVYLLCSGSRPTPQRLLLTGVAVSGVVSAVTLLVSLQISSDAYAFVVAFGAGSLNAAGWNYVAMLAAVLAVLVPLAWSFAPTLNVLRLGENTAAGLGVPLPWAPLALLSLAVVTCAACMALAGGVIFLGLIAPHIARRLVGADHSAAIPAAGLIGSTLLVLADVLGSSVLPDTEIPAGVMVSALGAPYFLYLLTRS
jgi:ferric hydroxamate transport system permease protein